MKEGTVKEVNKRRKEEDGKVENEMAKKDRE